MTFGVLLMLALGLAMDATAVAAARGFAARSIRLRDAGLVAVFFGGAQTLMPLLGWVLGDRVGSLISDWGRPVAFVVLAGIGAKMLLDARNDEDGPAKPATASPFGLRVLGILALVTSIDAFAAGITLPLLGAPIALSLTTIGLTTALLSGGAVFAGHRFGARLGRRLDVLGGVVLIALGLKILVEHVLRR